MTLRAAMLLTLAAPAAAAAQAQVQGSIPPPPAAPNYAQPDSWLCRPGRADACAANQDATIVRADGSRSVERFSRDAAPGFDCFYVYPTVSLDPTPNSDMVAGPEERTVAAYQGGRFGKHCRVFAPLYRQVTLAALRDILLGKPSAADRAMAYADVKAAWDEYLAYDNHGRGVVLIGHSQGSAILKQLVAQAIEGTPVQQQIISVIIPGTNVAVPEGKDVGGDLRSTPLCHSGKDVGCVISYVSFRADVPPPPTGRFGTVPQPGMVAACVNPAALVGTGARSDAYLGARGAGMMSAPQAAWSRDGAAVTTPFIKVPGLIGTACASAGKVRYLAVTTYADPADKRTDTIAGDVVVGNVTLKDWGLHLIDLSLAMGDLVALTNEQAKAWALRHPASPMP